MTPTDALTLSVATLVASDTTKLAAATALHVHLIQAPFTPSGTTDFTTLTEADFTGSAFKAAGTGTQQAFNDPITGQQIVQLLEPAGGWHWQATAGTNLPQTIYGYVVTDTANAVTWGSATFDTPFELLSIGDGLDIPEVRLTLPLNPLG